MHSQNEQRRCAACHQLFFPDARCRHPQRYCAAPVCRAVSKAESQRRWAAKAENRDYWRGEEEVRRVQRLGRSTARKAVPSRLDSGFVVGKAGLRV